MQTFNKASSHNPVLLCILSLSLALPAGAATLEDALAAMIVSEGDAYRTARGRALNASTPDEVRTALADSPPNADHWRRTAALLILDAHRTPGAFAPLHQAKGLDPAFYLRQRRADPMVSREFVAAKVHPGALIELLTKTADRFPFADDGQYPDSAVVRLASLRSKEEEALRTGLVTALARSGYGVARFVLADVLATPRFATARRQAAVMLPETGADAAWLVDVLTARVEGEDDARLRSSVAIGLGKTRTTRSLTALNALAHHDVDIDVRVAALRGLGAVGSSWAVHAEGMIKGNAFRADVGEALVPLLAQATTPRERQAAVDALGMVAHASTLEPLEAVKNSSTGATQKAAEQALRRVQRAVARAH